jgi:predicted ATPase
MFLKNLLIHNYKSLRGIGFRPQALSCLVGPNASGKSNFADSLEFLSEVYNHGLEVAVARKGGYENIAFRKMRRSKAAITFEVTVETPIGDFYEPFAINMMRNISKNTIIRFHHTFSFIALGGGIRAEFAIVSERFLIRMKLPKSNRNLLILRFYRDKTGSLKYSFGKKQVVKNLLQSEFDWIKNYFDKFIDARTIGKQRLIISMLGSFPMFNEFVYALSRFRVFRFSPQTSRLPGAPTPNPVLSTTGENLPSLVDWLQRYHPRLWKTVISGMQEIVPGLKKISVQYLHTKVLGLFFEEVGSGRPWIADDVSDGTIQSLAMLVATVDPRSSLLLIEEPENSIHPWIIRTMVDRFRNVSNQKTVILTTHSPILVDSLKPNELWIVSRTKGETSVTPIVDFDPELEDDWEEGKYRLSEALDSGLFPAAVPGEI